MDPITDKILAEIADGVGWITINNPERRNAISDEMQAAMTQILINFQNDPAVRVVVMTGAGDKAFASGRDLSQFDRRQEPAPSGLGGRAALDRAFDLLEKPLIAMIRGYCLGGGLGVALRADLRIAADDAKFGIPTARLGNVYRSEMLARVVGLIGASHTAEMVFTADHFGAEEALTMGLVNRVVAADGLEESVRRLARRIAENAPLTIRASKAILRELAKPKEERNLAYMSELERLCFESADFKEGRLAFKEKRKPVFAGR